MIKTGSATGKGNEGRLVHLKVLLHSELDLGWHEDHKDSPAFLGRDDHAICRATVCSTFPQGALCWKSSSESKGHGYRRGGAVDRLCKSKQPEHWKLQKEPFTPPMYFKIRRGKRVNGGSGIFHLLSCFVVVSLTINLCDYCTRRQWRLKSEVQRRRPKTADSSRQRGDLGRAFRSWCL